MKIHRSLLLLITTFIFGLSTLNAQILINEARIDNVGTDTDEYFELWGASGTSLDGLTYIVIGDGTGGSGVIESVSDLTGLSIGLNGVFLGGTNSMTLATPDAVFSLQFENSDNVTHILVSGFTGSSGDDLDTNDDGVLDITPWTSVLDAVSLVETVDTPASGEFFYGSYLGGVDVGPDGTFVPGHIYRMPDGGVWQIGSFDLGVNDTPGVTNVPEPSTVAAILGLFALGYVMYRRRK